MLLVPSPVIEVMLRHVENFPSFMLQEPRQLLLGTWLLSERPADFLQMVLHSNFLLMENVMQIKQIVERHEINWVDQTLLIQESFHLKILVVLNSLIVELNLVEISFSIVEFVNVILEIQLGQLVHQEKSGELERLVVGYWQNFFLGQGALDHVLPDCLVGVVSEHQVVDQVGQSWVV